MSQQSFHQQTATGADINFTITTFSSDEILVYVDGVKKTAGAHYNINPYNSNGQSTVDWIGTAPSSPSIVRIIRQTDVMNNGNTAVEGRATFQAGSSVKADDLNNNTKQVLRSIQELQDQKIQSYDLEDLSITTDNIANNAVTTDKIAANAVTGAKIATGAVLNSNLAANAVNSTNIIDLAVNTSKINNAAVTTVKIADSNVTTAKIADSNVTTAKIADDAITNAKIGPGAVGTTEINTSAVTTAKIADDSVTNAKIADDAVDSDQIANGSIDHVHLGNDIIGEENIADGAVRTEHLTTGSVTTAKIADSGVTGGKIAASTITSANLATGAVLNSNLAADAVNSTNILDLAVNTAKINNNAVTTAKIADDAVTNAKIGNNAVTTDTISNGSVTTAKIADDAVTADKLANSINTEISANTTKLSGIEAGATADQTAAEIRTLVESASDSNVFTDADHTKLGNAVTLTDAQTLTNKTLTTPVINDFSGTGIVTSGTSTSDNKVYSAKRSDELYSTGASQAAPSATAAANSATAAASSQSAAASSATSAASSATTATTQASTATTQAANALTHLNTFKGQYLGALSSYPINDSLGNAVDQGDIYFNTTSDQVRVFNGTTFQGISENSVDASRFATSDFSALYTASAGSNSINLGGLAISGAVFSTENIPGIRASLAKGSATYNLGGI